MVLKISNGSLEPRLMLLRRVGRRMKGGAAIWDTYDFALSREKNQVAIIHGQTGSK